MSYPSDLTDKEWESIKDFFNCGKYGNQAVHEKRLLVNAVRYLKKKAVSGDNYQMIFQTGQLFTLSSEGRN